MEEEDGEGSKMNEISYIVVEKESGSNLLSKVISNFGTLIDNFKIKFESTPTWLSKDQV